MRPAVKLAAFAALTAAAIGLTALAIVLTRPAPPNPPCEPGVPCASPPKSPVAAPHAVAAVFRTGVQWTSDLGPGLRYPKNWDVAESDKRTLVVKGENGQGLFVVLAIIVRPSSRAPLDALRDQVSSERGGSFLGVDADNSDKHVVVSPEIGYVHGVSAVYKATVDQPPSPSEQVELAFMAARHGNATIVVEAITNQGAQSGSANSPFPAFEVVDSILTSFTWGSAADMRARTLLAVAALAAAAWPSGRPAAAVHELGATPPGTTISFVLRLRLDRHLLDRDLAAGRVSAPSAAALGARYGHSPRRRPKGRTRPGCARHPRRRELPAAHRSSTRAPPSPRSGASSACDTATTPQAARSTTLRPRAPTIPPGLRPFVTGIVGLSTRPVATPADLPHGTLLPDDAALAYDFAPLRKQGVDGTGETIAILSLSHFPPDVSEARDDVATFRDKFAPGGPDPVDVKIDGGGKVERRERGRSRHRRRSARSRRVRRS